MAVKMRGGDPSKNIRQSGITSKGVFIGDCLKDYDHLITGIPSRAAKTFMRLSPVQILHTEKQ
jgi:hypothetical protein